MYKTWLMLELAISLASGKPFLGTYKVNKTGPVLLVQQEDPFPLLLDRASCILNVGPVSVDEEAYSVAVPAEFPDIYFHTDRALRFDDKEVMAAFEDVVRKINPVVAIIDPLYSAAKADDYMAEAAQEMLFLKRLRDDTGTSFIVTHHMNRRAEGDRSRDKLWGSQFLNAWLETGWQLEPSMLGHVDITRHFKSSESPRVITLKFTIEEGRFSVRQVQSEDMDIDARITSLVRSNKAKSMSQIMEETGIKSKSTVAAAIKRVGAVKTDDGYRIP